MRRFTGNTIRCACGRPTDHPRRGMCPGCYLAAYHGREKGPACEACSHADPRALVRRKMRGRALLVTLCGNCAAVLGRRPLELEELRAEVRPAGDRRSPERRRGLDRRALERRAPMGDRRAARFGQDDRRSLERRASR